MPRIRVRPETGTLFFDFRYRGVRCREQTLLADTPANRARLGRFAERIKRELAQGTFRYADFFPDSRRAARFEEASAATADSGTDVSTPSEGASLRFAEFAELWVLENVPRWRRPYQEFIRETLDRFILPAFGERELGSITRADLLGFRADFAKRRGRSGGTVGPDRINKVMRITRSILEEACNRFGLDSPARGIKPLKLRRTEVEPFTLEEVERILATVRAEWKPYLTVRMFTGLRTGEANGLQWQDIDFTVGVVRVRRTVSRGGDGDTKTDASMRDVPMVPQVRKALIEQRGSGSVGPEDWVFRTVRGNPIDAVNFTNRVWYPLLRHLGLRPRRPYQMRHTAATLMLAAGENPEWIARVLGHTTTEMLFRTYSRYVPNLTRNDGRAYAGLLGGHVAATPAGDSDTRSADKEAKE